LIAYLLGLHLCDYGRIFFESKKHNKRLKRDCQRVAALVQNLSSVFTVCFLSSAMRCQPLSRALAEWW